MTMLASLKVMPSTLTSADVLRIAELARLELSEAEVELFSRQITDILGYAEQVREVDTSGVSPPSHPLDVHAGRDEIQHEHARIAHHCPIGDAHCPTGEPHDFEGEVGHGAGNRAVTDDEPESRGHLQYPYSVTCSTMPGWRLPCDAHLPSSPSACC